MSKKETYDFDVEAKKLWERLNIDITQLNNGSKLNIFY